MSKCLNEITFKEIIENCLKESHQDYQDRYDHDTDSDSVPYGDTWVSSGNYITEESEERATEEWKDTFDIYDFITEYLANNQDFEDKIIEMVRGF